MVELTVKDLIRLLKDAFAGWQRNNASLMAAGLSYYTVFSMAPMLMLAIAVVGIVLGDQAAEGEIVRQLSGLMGDDLAHTVEGLVNNARTAGVGKATGLSVLLLLYGASGMFGQLQRALNMIWDVRKPPPGGLFSRFLKNRLIIFGMTLGVGALLLLSFIVNAGLGALENTLGHLPLMQQAGLWRALSLAVQFGVIALFTAFIFKFLPQTRIAWKDVWIGATVTSGLLCVGVYVIALYFRFSNFMSIYGVASSVIVLFIWVNLSAQIFFYGAEFTRTYAKAYGSRHHISS